MSDWVEKNVMALLAVLVSCATTLITLTVIYTHLQDTIDSMKEARKADIEAQHITNISVDGRLNALTDTANGIKNLLDIQKERAKWEAEHTQPPTPPDSRKR